MILSANTRAKEAKNDSFAYSFTELFHYAPFIWALKGTIMTENTPLEHFLDFMRIKGDESAQEVQEFVISNDDELKQCKQAFGEPMNLIEFKDFR